MLMKATVKFVAMLQLFYVGAFAMQDETYPSPLSSMKFGFYIHSINATLLYSEIAASTVCVSVYGLTESYCVNSQFGWLRIPVHISGRCRISFLSPSETSTEWFLVNEINEIPTTLAWAALSPAYGRVSTSKRLQVYLQSNTPMLQEGDELVVDFVDVQQMIFPSSFSYMDSHGDPEIEPGSWFFQVSQVTPETFSAHSSVSPSSLANRGYIEFVLSRDEIVKHRKLMNTLQRKRVGGGGGGEGESAGMMMTSLRESRGSSGPSPRSLSSLLLSTGGRKTPLSTAVPSSLKPLLQESVSPDSPGDSLSQQSPGEKGNRPGMLCIWGTDHMDGQKTIWLEQMKNLNRERFRFSYILTGGGGGDGGKGDTGQPTVQANIDGKTVNLLAGGMTLKVHALEHVLIYPSPLESLPLSVDDFQFAPTDGSPSLRETWDGSELQVAAYILKRLEAAGGVLDQVSPMWCRDYLTEAVARMKRLSCDAIVYGNNRGENSDRLLVSLARYMSVPSVGELLNLFVEVIPDVIVAPSHFAVTHPSVEAALELNRKSSGHSLPLRGRAPPAVVISPGIDFEAFRKSPATEAKQVQAVVKIAFIGRLAIEKNPGLFLMAAYELLQKHPFCRFVVVGDGKLRSELRTLSFALGIDWAVTFTGWVSEVELPGLLEEIDVVVNPSLRAWSETFCITNLQVMAMQIPLVTFGVGGVGEYIIPPVLTSPSTKKDGRSHRRFHEESDTGEVDFETFSVSPNSVLVNEASPQALADAVAVLVTNAELREHVGKAGYESIREFFTSDRQMREYEELYGQLLFDRHHH